MLPRDRDSERVIVMSCVGITFEPQYDRSHCFAFSFTHMALLGQKQRERRALF